MFMPLFLILNFYIVVNLTGSPWGPLSPCGPTEPCQKINDID